MWILSKDTNIQFFTLSSKIHPPSHCWSFSTLQALNMEVSIMMTLDDCPLKAVVLESVHWCVLEKKGEQADVVGEIWEGPRWREWVLSMKKPEDGVEGDNPGVNDILVVGTGGTVLRKWYNDHVINRYLCEEQDQYCTIIWGRLSFPFTVLAAVPILFHHQHHCNSDVIQGENSPMHMHKQIKECLDMLLPSHWSQESGVWGLSWFRWWGHAKQKEQEEWKKINYDVLYQMWDGCAQEGGVSKVVSCNMSRLHVLMDFSMGV